MHHHDDSPDGYAERGSGPQVRQLLDVTAALGGATTLDEAARLLVEHGISAVGASGGSLSILDERATGFEVLYARGLPAASVQTFRRFPLQAGRPLSDAVLSRTSVFLDDSAAWERHYPEMAPAIQATGAGALAVVPVSTASGAIAGLSLAWPASRGFDDATRDFLSTLGALCGHAIERARLARSERESRAEADAAITQLREQAVGLEQALDQARSLTRELAASVAQARAAALAAEQASTRERILARLGGALADSLAGDGDGRPGHDVTLQRLVDVIVPDFADWCVIDIIEPGSDATDAPLVAHRAAMAHADPARRASLLEMAERYPPDPARYTLGGVAVATGRAQLIPRVTDELLHSVAHDAAQVVLARRLGMHSAIVVPLAAHGVSEGVAVFVSAEREYGADDLVLAEEVGRRAALAIDNARLLRELERERADLATVLAVVPVGIGIARDPACWHVRVNPAFARQLCIGTDDNASLSAPDAGALPFRVMSGGHEVPAEQLPMQVAAREGRLVSEVELDIVHDDGRVTRLLESAAPLLDRFNRVRGAVGAFVDITERAALVEAERAARATAEEASLAKTHLLSVLSHELRTPVNSVMAHAQLIDMGLHGPVSGEQREALSRIHRSAQHLTGLITDLLNLSRIEQGRITYDLCPVPVGETLAALVGLLEPQATEKALTLVVDPIPSTISATADADRLQQILLNLVGNAIKFTERGGRVALGAAPDGDIVRITVTDTGSGIPADHLDAIFDRFVQVNPALTRRAGGMGLGLSISRDLARGMGGELSVESASGIGSTFTLTLPRADDARPVAR